MVTALAVLALLQMATMIAVAFMHHRQQKIMTVSTAGMKALLDAMSTLQNENISLAQHQVNLRTIVHHHIDKMAMIEEVVKYLSETRE